MGRSGDIVQSFRTDYPPSEQGRLEQLRRDMERAALQPAPAWVQLTQAMQGAGGGVAGLAFKFNQVSGVVSFVVNQVKNLVNEFGQFAEHGSRVNDLFENLPGSIEPAQQALGGLVSKVELARLRNELMLRGVELTDTQFGELANAAGILSDKLGIDALQAFQQLSDGVSIGNQRLLKRLGVFVDLQKAETDYATQLGTTREKLTEEQQQHGRQQAILDAITKKYKDVRFEVHGLGDEYTRLGTAAKDVIDGIARDLDALGKKKGGPGFAELLAAERARMLSRERGFESPEDEKKAGEDIEAAGKGVEDRRVALLKRRAEAAKALKDELTRLREDETRKSIEFTEAEETAFSKAEKSKTETVKKETKERESAHRAAFERAQSFARDLGAVAEKQERADKDAKKESAERETRLARLKMDKSRLVADYAREQEGRRRDDTERRAAAEADIELEFSQAREQAVMAMAQAFMSAGAQAFSTWIAGGEQAASMGHLVAKAMAQFAFQQGMIYSAMAVAALVGIPPFFVPRTDKAAQAAATAAAFFAAAGAIGAVAAGSAPKGQSEEERWAGQEDERKRKEAWDKAHGIERGGGGAGPQSASGFTTTSERGGAISLVMNISGVIGDKADLGRVVTEATQAAIAHGYVGTTEVAGRTVVVYRG